MGDGGGDGAGVAIWTDWCRMEPLSPGADGPMPAKRLLDELAFPELYGSGGRIELFSNSTGSKGGGGL